MTEYRLRVVALAAAILLLAACTGPKRVQPYGNWSYVETKLDPFWWTTLIDVSGARKTTKGRGATVAIVGTGVLRGHEDLPTVVAGEATCGSTPADTNDLNGHGTQLAGIAVGLWEGHATMGVAPEATLIPIKVDCCGVVSAEALTKGVDAAIARKPDIILIAIGGYPSGPPDVSAFMLSRVTANPGILFVVASVWDGTYYAFPAWTQTDNTLVVAAMTLDSEKTDRTKVTNKEIPYGARRGAIWAPGRQVGTADIEAEPGITTHSQFLMHGTSPAAAMVTGCAALVKSKTGTGGGAALKGALLSGAKKNKVDGPEPNGRLNCAEAIP
jgi:subtilisin family serine protease